MDKPKVLDAWSFTDTEMVPDGWDMKTIPKMSERNFRTLLEEHNNLVEVVNMICEKQGITVEGVNNG